MWPYFVMSLPLRQKLTRVLCWLAILSATFGIVAGAILIGVLVLGFSDLAPDFRLGVLTFWRSVGLTLVWVCLAFYVAQVACRFVLWFWRSCDRCSRRLFSDGAQFGPPANTLPHYKARQVFFSYWWGAVIDFAFRGRAFCVWCGHEDGTKVKELIAKP